MNVLKMAGYVRQNVHDYGVAAASHDLGCRLLNQLMFFQIQRGMTIRMQDVKDRSLFEAPGFDARVVAEDQLWELARVGSNQISPEFLRTALARGDHCYAIFDGQALASYCWYSERPTPLDENFVLHFDRAWLYVYKSYTLPSYRGRRLHAFRLCQALEAVTEMGKKGLISCVASNNYPSLRSVSRMGFRFFGDIWLLRAAGRSVSYATGNCAEHGFRAEPRESDCDLLAPTELSKQ